MSVAPLIRELREVGIHLSANGDRLHVEAPAGTITPELRQRLTEKKVELLAELRKPTDPRTALLALADRLGLDRSAVMRIPSADLPPLWASVPADALPDYLRAYLLALDDTATRQTGKVPPSDTAAIYCQRCGPVYVHPGIAAVLHVVNGWPRALGCPWCAIRKAGGHVPRPRVTCETCRHFQPDAINPAAGVGGCASGHGTHYPTQRHGCGDFSPSS